MVLLEDGKRYEAEGDTIGEELAVKLRNGEISQIDAYLK